MIHSPLREAHLRLGARFVVAAGWEMALHYGDARREHEAIRKRVGLIDLSHRGKLLVRGRDRATFLHGMVTNDVKGLSEGQGQYAAMITAQGRTLSDLRVCCRADRLLLDLEPGQNLRVSDTLKRYLVSEDVVLEDITEAMALLAFHGPRSGDVLEGNLGAGASRLREFESVDRDGALLFRVDETGGPGYYLYAPAAKAISLWADLVERGDVQPAGLEAYRVARMEAGVPAYGLDMEEEATPIESGLTHAVSFRKGCYLGQEVLAKMTHRGRPRRHLVGFLLDGGDPPQASDRVFKAGEEIGRITSGARSYSLERAIAYGYVKRDMNLPGERIEIASCAGMLPGRIVIGSFLRVGEAEAGEGKGGRGGAEGVES